jgi:prohibitin 1
MEARLLNTIYRLALPAAIGVGAVQSSIYDVKGGSRAVIFDRLSGVKEEVVSEGTHFLIPWLQRAIQFDVRTKPRNIATTTGSKDLQMVSLTLRVLHRPEVKALPKIYQVCIGLDIFPGGRLYIHGCHTETNSAKIEPRLRLRREGTAVHR